MYGWESMDMVLVGVSKLHRSEDMNMIWFYNLSVVLGHVNGEEMLCGAAPGQSCALPACWVRPGILLCAGRSLAKCSWLGTNEGGSGIWGTWSSKIPWCKVRTLFTITLVLEEGETESSFFDLGAWQCYTCVLNFANLSGVTSTPNSVSGKEKPQR